MTKLKITIIGLLQSIEKLALINYNINMSDIKTLDKLITNKDSIIKNKDNLLNKKDIEINNMENKINLLQNSIKNIE